ncbi:hypothetical protein V6615_01050 [Oscillospiraceae bacterium PP1C4]
MENDKNLEKQADALKEEDLESVSGGMIRKGNMNPACPRCNSATIIVAKDGVMQALARCPKCGYEWETTIAYWRN